MLTLEEAQDLVLASLAPLPPERVGLLEAVGRVLAESVVARRALPPTDNSAMDGYAGAAADLARPGRLRVVTTAAAGGPSAAPLGPGEVARIFTGASLPPGADTVVPQEHTRAEGETVELLRPVAPGTHVRPRGDDVEVGEGVLAPGTVVGPAEVAALAAQGRTLVAVHRRPRVGLFANGDELAEPDEPVAGDRIANTNGWALAAACLEAGAQPVLLGIAADTPESVADHLEAARGCDVVVASGGVSVGDFDYVKQVFEARGLAEAFWRVAIKPGKPVLHGRLEGRPCFGLPGNPVSSVTTFEVLVRPVLRRLAGFSDVLRPRLRVRLAEAAPAARGRRHLVWAALAWGADGWTARPIPRAGSHRLGSATGAHCLIPVPPDHTLPAGSEVEVWLTRAP